MNEDTLIHETVGGHGGADPTSDFVTMPRAELEALRAVASANVEVRERESDYARRLAELDRKAAEWEQNYKSALRDREIATALAGRPLVPGAATQLLKLWRDEFDVIEEDGRPKVVSRDGRSAERAVTDWLSSPEFAHFRPPSTRGGTALTGAPRDVPPGTGHNVARTLGETLLFKWREATVGLADPAAPVGLGRRR
jgi:hypothetical protein